MHVAVLFKSFKVTCRKHNVSNIQERLSKQQGMRFAHVNSEWLQPFGSETRFSTSDIYWKSISTIENVLGHDGNVIFSSAKRQSDY